MVAREDVRGEYLERTNEEARQMVAMEKLDIVGGGGCSWLRSRRWRSGTYMFDLS